MTTVIEAEHFRKALLEILNETFDSVHGIYLDKGTSMFETLSGISAQEASIPVGGTCATLAAQVKHVAFYLDVLEQGMRTQQFEKQDWGKIWRETSAVTPDEWEGLKLDLRQSYDRMKQLIQSITEWPNEDVIAEAISTIVHTAYHLGEIRQALCVIKGHVLQPEFVSKPAFTIVGMLLRTSPMSPEIPQLWTRFGPRMHELQHVVEPDVSYGMMGNYAENMSQFDYMAGQSVTQLADMPEGMSTWDIAASTYAVFKTSLATMGQTFDQIYATWLPSSGYKHAAAPIFERYGAEFDPDDPSSPFDIYIPIEK